MAKLVLTEQEIEAKTFLEWDDEALGKLVKKLAIHVGDTSGEASSTTAAAALLLVSQCHETGAVSMNIEMQKILNGEEKLGDWSLTINKLQPATEEAAC